MCEKIPTESQCFLGIEISVGILFNTESDNFTYHIICYRKYHWNPVRQIQVSMQAPEKYLKRMCWHYTDTKPPERFQPVSAVPDFRNNNVDRPL